MIEIALTQGRVALIDDDDLLVVDGNRYYAIYAGRNLWYAARNVPHPLLKNRQKIIYMQWDIMGEGLWDHIDGNGLNNSRSNIRLASVLDNAHNNRMYVTNTSGFKGVSFHRSVKKWQAQITVSNGKKFLGYYNDPEDAARAYDTAARQLFGEFAKVNFL